MTSRNGSSHSTSELDPIRKAKEWCKTHEKTQKKFNANSFIVIFSLLRRPKQWTQKLNKRSKHPSHQQEPTIFTRFRLSSCTNPLPNSLILQSSIFNLFTHLHTQSLPPCPPPLPNFIPLQPNIPMPSLEHNSLHTLLLTRETMVR
jgi:hypothetical protein